MAKGSFTRAPISRLQDPPPVRIHTEREPLGTSAALERMLSAVGRFRQPGDIAIYSGVAQAEDNTLRRDLSAPLDWGSNLWGWTRWSIDAPPPGSQVLWLTLELASQFWRLETYRESANDTDHYQYRDISVTWRWLLLPNPFGESEPKQPPCMGDGARYDFWASKPPGGKHWTAWWVTPSRSATLTPYDKESDPNAFTVLLQSEYGGSLHLKYFYQFPSVSLLGPIYGVPGPDSLHFSMGVVTPKPFISAGALKSATPVHAFGSRPDGRVAKRERHTRAMRRTAERSTRAKGAARR